MTRELGSDQLVRRAGAETTQDADCAGTRFSLELEQLFECEDVMRYLAKGHVFFAKKVGISSDLANCLADLLKRQDIVRSVEKRTVADLRTIDYSNQQSEAPSILLIDSSALEENISESLQSALDLSESVGTAVWLVSFPSLIDRRILARFNCFFAFPSSPTELDILSDVLPVPKHY